MNMFGLTYLQQISDKNLNAGLHIEPGLFAAVPKTTDPDVPPMVVRLGSIPHGTTVLLQGTAATAAAAPEIPDDGIKPFTAGQPNAAVGVLAFNLWLETLQGQDRPPACVRTLGRNEDSRLSFHQALAALYRAGVPLDFAARYPRPRPARCG